MRKDKIARHNELTTEQIWLGLKLCPSVRNKLYVYSERAGGPKKLWKMSLNELLAIGIKEQDAKDFIDFKSSFRIENEMKKLSKHDLQIITEENDLFPAFLKNIPYYPRAFFVKGNFQKYNYAVAIVGSRRATSYGISIAYELAYEIAKAGVTIISGGARGIDSSAHKGAIDANGITYAVLGTGLDQVYPRENRKLFEMILHDGALISEYPLGTPPLSHHFPARNRIVAGMSNAIVVVEASEKSGALITADFALNYGREVFAVPGSLKSQTSKGTNSLIKQGAYLIEEASDVLYALGIKAPNNIDKNQETSDKLNEKENQFLELIGWDGKNIEQIINQSFLSYSEISVLLLNLEMHGFIKKDITGKYLRLR